MSEIKSIRNFTLVPVLGQYTESLKSEAIAFWKKEGVVAPNSIEERASQLVMVALNANGEIIATSTAAKVKVKLLNGNWLYQYRCYIKPKFRVVGFDVHLTTESLKLLEAQSKKEPSEAAIGVLVVVENPNLTKTDIHRAAVWRAYKMYFIGYNSKGQPIRVYYFKGARI